MRWRAKYYTLDNGDGDLTEWSRSSDNGVLTLWSGPTDTFSWYIGYAMTNSHLYSMIDVGRLDVHADANFKFTNDFWLNFYYRYSDFEDNITLFGDMNGNISIFGTYLGWAF